MPKKKEEVFEIVAETPIKKRRKRKPMTVEEKKAFGEKMKLAKQKKAEALANQIVAKRESTNKPKEPITPVTKVVNQQQHFDSNHFEQLSNHIRELNSNIINLTNVRSQVPKSVVKEIKEEPPKKEEVREEKIKEIVKEVERAIPSNEDPYGRRKVYNVRRKCYVYI